MEPDFLVQIENIGTPMPKAIDMSNINSFIRLYFNENSDFRKWYDTNLQNLEKLYTSKDLFNNYFVIPINEIANNMVSYVNFFYFLGKQKILSEKIGRREIPVMTGGISENDIIIFCIGILFYLFSPDEIDEKMVPPVPEKEFLFVPTSVDISPKVPESEQTKFVRTSVSRDSDEIGTRVPEFLRTPFSKTSVSLSEDALASSKEVPESEQTKFVRTSANRGSDEIGTRVPTKSAIQRGGLKIKDISGHKSDQRLVYIVGLKGKKVVMKIMWDDESYKKEIKIYDELNQEMVNDPFLKDKIIKKYSTNTNIDVIESKIIFRNINLETGMVNISISQEKMGQHYNKIYDFIEGVEQSEAGRKAIYIVLEYLPVFKTVEHINKNNLLAVDDRCIVAENVISTLVYLNNKLGFCHWDLHKENLLINVNTNEFKLFDFDLSSTRKNENDEIFKRINYDLSTDRIKYGLVYDVYRFVIDFKLYDCPTNENLQYVIQKVKKDQAFINKKSTILDQSDPYHPRYYIDGRKYYEQLFEYVKNSDIYPYIQKLEPKIPPQPAITGNLTGGYLSKYYKYKTKYINLKKILHP